MIGCWGTPPRGGGVLYLGVLGDVEFSTPGAPVLCLGVVGVFIPLYNSFKKSSSGRVLHLGVVVGFWDGGGGVVEDSAWWNGWGFCIPPVSAPATNQRLGGPSTSGTVSYAKFNFEGS